MKTFPHIITEPNSPGLSLGQYKYTMTSKKAFILRLFYYAIKDQIQKKSSR